MSTSAKARALSVASHICAMQRRKSATSSSERRSAASAAAAGSSARRTWVRRSEEHTSELQSLMRISYAVFCLKKKTKKKSCQTEPPTQREIRAHTITTFIKVTRMRYHQQEHF